MSAGIRAWLRRRAENVAAALLAAMFAAFVLQVVFRYVFDYPVGWTSELTVICWLWLVLWGSALVLREDEEIRFDLLSASVGRRARLAMAALCALAIVILYGSALKASYDYVSFMKVEKSSYLKIPMDWLYSIFLVFMVAAIVRYLWRLAQLARGSDPDLDPGP